jgi:RHS repeat-associated protein
MSYGRPSRVTLPNGLVQIAEHDEVARTATSGTSPTGDLSDAELTTTVHLDDAGRVTGTDEVRADGASVPSTTTQFDGFGRVVRAEDGVAATTTEYDAFGNAIVTEVGAADADPDASAGEYASAMTAERRFHASGVSLEKTLRSGEAAQAGERRELDLLGRVVSVTDQRGVTEHIDYAADGLVERVASDTGRVTSFAYDPDTRDLIGSAIVTPAGTVATSYARDGAGRVIGVFDPADRAGTEIAYDLDAFGNATRTRYPDGTELRREFDEHGRATITIDAAGNRTARTYDPFDGALIAVVQHDRHGTALGRVEYDHDEFGRIDRLVRDTGVVTEFTFTSTGEIATDRTVGPSGVHSEREYAYSPAGDLATRIDRVADEHGDLETTTTGYEYDVLDRLVRSTVREGAGDDAQVTKTTEYTATVAGDLGTEVVTRRPGTPEEVTTTRGFEYSEVGELTAVVTDGVRRAQQFDAEGSLVGSADGAQYVYDAAGRLTAQTALDGTVVETSYWADGTRREQRDEAGTIRSYWDGDTLLNEVHAPDEGPGGVASYLIGTSRHARVVQTADAEPTTMHYGLDRHGNVAELSDARGAVTTRYEYSDYGVATVSGATESGVATTSGATIEENPFTYASAYTFRDGSQELGARIYVPAEARFRSQDPEALANRYAFADLNPVMNVDPTGREAERDWVNVGLVLGGFVGSVVGALLMLGTGGAALTGLGAAGLVMAGGDVVVAGFEVANLFSEVRFVDDEMTAVASWTLLAIGVGFTIGGLVSKASAHFAKSAGAAAPKKRKVEQFVKQVSDDEIALGGDGRPRTTSEERARWALAQAEKRLTVLEGESEQIQQQLKNRHLDSRLLGASLFNELRDESEWTGVRLTAEHAIGALQFDKAKKLSAEVNLAAAESALLDARTNADSLMNSALDPAHDELANHTNVVLGALMTDHVRNADQRLAAFAAFLGTPAQNSPGAAALTAIAGFRKRLAPFVPQF